MIISKFNLRSPNNFIKLTFLYNSNDYKKKNLLIDLINTKNHFEIKYFEKKNSLLILDENLSCLFFVCLLSNKIVWNMRFDLPIVHFTLSKSSLNIIFVMLVNYFIWVIFRMIIQVILQILINQMNLC